jgi:hypothetical protein
MAASIGHMPSRRPIMNPAAIKIATVESITVIFAGVIAAISLSHGVIERTDGEQQRAGCGSAGAKIPY